jgi:YtkA-like
MRSALLRIGVIGVMLLALAACGPGSITQTNRTERYSVQMTLDRAQVGPRIITIAVNDSSGAPATVDQVVVAPVMSDMGMAEPEMVAAQVGPGRYEIRDEPFSMLGIWELTVRITAGGQEDTTMFSVEVK